MPVQNAINNSAVAFPGSVTVSGHNYVKAYASGIGSGDTDLYTAPPGKRAYVFQANLMNNTVTSTNVTYEIKVSSVYYPISIVYSAGSSSQEYDFPNIILEPGESFSINCSANAQLNAWINIFEYDSTSAIYTSKVLTLSNGDNTIYTVPSGKTSYILGLSGSLVFPSVYFLKSSFNIINFSGSTNDYLAYCVSSGDVPSSSNSLITYAYPVSGSQIFNIPNFFATLSQGDYFVVNTNSGSAGQTAYVNVMEI